MGVLALLHFELSWWFPTTCLICLLFLFTVHRLGTNLSLHFSWVNIKQLLILLLLLNHWHPRALRWLKG
ncbi:hypothetical protein AKJ16_DCAP24588 [Drosera capensis]